MDEPFIKSGSDHSVRGVCMFSTCRFPPNRTFNELRTPKISLRCESSPPRLHSKGWTSLGGACFSQKLWRGPIFTNISAPKFVSDVATCCHQISYLQRQLCGSGCKFALIQWSVQACSCNCVYFVYVIVCQSIWVTHSFCMESVPLNPPKS